MQDHRDAILELLQDGGIGISVAFLALVVPTTWLELAPPPPAGLEIAILAALANVIGCAGRSVRRLIRRTTSDTENAG